MRSPTYHGHTTALQLPKNVSESAEQCSAHGSRHALSEAFSSNFIKCGKYNHIGAISDTCRRRQFVTCMHKSVALRVDGTEFDASCTRLDMLSVFKCRIVGSWPNLNADCFGRPTFISIGPSLLVYAVHTSCAVHTAPPTVHNASLPQRRAHDFPVLPASQLISLDV